MCACDRYAGLRCAHHEAEYNQTMAERRRGYHEPIKKEKKAVTNLAINGHEISPAILEVLLQDPDSIDGSSWHYRNGLQRAVIDLTGVTPSALTRYLEGERKRRQLPPLPVGVGLDAAEVAMTLFNAYKSAEHASSVKREALMTLTWARFFQFVRGIAYGAGHTPRPGVRSNIENYCADRWRVENRGKETSK